MKDTSLYKLRGCSKNRKVGILGSCFSVYDRGYAMDSDYVVN